jgi:hypothetical protein
MNYPFPPDLYPSRTKAIRAADHALDVAVDKKRVLLRDAAITSLEYCAACWRIITVRKEAARLVDQDYPAVHLTGAWRPA